MINSDRITQRFIELAQIDSVSRQEGEISARLTQILEDMGAKVIFDNAGEKVNGQIGNLIARFPGNTGAEPIFLSGHMDTVEPGNGVKVQFKDGIFTSDGTTILGADDKSALAIILEAMDCVLENNLPHPPVEIIFTICEEIGLLGAVHLDYSLIESRFGYILDSTDTEGIVTRAPASNKIDIMIKGRAAHAGAAPEKGISAIKVAADAISSLHLGRIDAETTCNLGTIAGGLATNIVPEEVHIRGEARSHSDEKLDRVTQTILDAFFTSAKHHETRNGTDNGLPKIDTRVEQDFPRTNIPEDHLTVRLARKAAGNLGYELESKTIGGGADANIFFSKGIIAGVLGTGMKDVHTLKENIALADMVKTTGLILEILRVHAAGEPV